MNLQEPQSASFFYLQNERLKVTVTNYGARITSVILNDKNGTPTDVVTGFNTIDEYLHSTAPYYGATIGRYANRIANGKFELNGVEYKVPVNNGPNSLHGGEGFHEKIWQVTAADDDSIELKYLSADGEQGYPGELAITVSFTLVADALHIGYSATSTKDTVVNFTNHAYFNLNGEGNGDILGHKLQIKAQAYTPVNENLIPTGELATVSGTPFDFNQPHTIGERIGQPDQQLTFGNGYDHNYVLSANKSREPQFAAKAWSDHSGICLEVLTTEPGMQFYSGNFMDGTNTFKHGSADDARTAFCLETQHFPDSPNQHGFPDTTLKAGEQFSSQTVYRFFVEA